MSAEVAQPIFIKEFATQSEAELFAENHPDLTPFVYFITGGSKLYYSNFNSTSINYAKVINEIVGGTADDEIILPKDLASLRGSAFRDMRTVKKITLPDTITQYLYPGYLCCNDYELEEINYAPAIVDGITTFPVYEFYNCNALQTIGTIDTSQYTVIGTYAFFGCNELADTISFPNVTTVNAYAFQNAYKLKLNFGTPKLTTIGNYAFTDARALTSIDLTSVTTINIYAFQNCTSLQSVVFNNGTSKCTTIFNNAFQNCTSLTSITIPSTVTNAGFYNNNNNNRKNIFNGCTSLQTVNIIGTNIVGLAEGTFRDCTSLTNAGITLPNTITTIQTSCFNGCTSLTKPVYRNDRTAHTSFGTYCFSGCTGITSLDIPAGQTSFPGYIFNGCTGLIGNLTLPSNITSIGEGCFQGCTNITYFKASEGFTSLGKKCFFNCSGLITVDLPSTFTTFVAATSGAGTFQNCTSMTTLIIRAITPPANLNAYTFQGIKTGGKIYVPKGSLATYQAVAGWYTTNSNYWPKKMGWTLNELDTNGNIPS